jgi:hypothetical protein
MADSGKMKRKNKGHRGTKRGLTEGRNRDENVGVENERIKPTLHMPRDMAMQRPQPRVVGREAQDHVSHGWDRDRIPAHWVLQVPSRDVDCGAVVAWPPAHDLERVSAFTLCQWRDK